MDRNSDIRTHTPRDLFLTWLLGLPDGVSVESAARTEIARIDGIASPSDELRSLRGLFHQAAATNPHFPSRRRARRH